MRLWLLFIAILVAGCGSSDLRKPSSPDQMREDLQQYYEGVTEAWAYVDSKRLNQAVDLAPIRDRLLTRIDASTTPQRFSLILQEFAAALQDGHSLAMTSSLGEPFPNSWPLGVLLVEEGVIVSNLNWLVDNPGIRLGDRLILVQDQTIESCVRARMTVTSASTDLARRVLAVDTLHWTSAEQVGLTLERSDGSQYDVNLPCLPHRIDYRQQPQSEFCTHELLDNRIGKIRIPKFTWNEKAFLEAGEDHGRDAALEEAKDQIDAAFAAVEKCSGLILDLRNNSGGFELLSSYVAEHLVSGNFKYYDSERRDAKLIRSLDAFQQLDDQYFGQRIPQHPRDWKAFRHFEGVRYEGPLVVLTNPRCFSTTDNLCAFLKDSRPQTRFVGQPTNGGTGEPATVFTLRHSGVPVQFCISKIFAPHGRLIEGAGTQPDVVVQPTRGDVLAGRDVILSTALKLTENW